LRHAPVPGAIPLGLAAAWWFNRVVRTLIIGCGYVGLPLGAELARRGHAVVGVRRSAEGWDARRAAGITPAVADVTQPETLRSLAGPFDWVVNAVSSTKGGADEYRAVYLNGVRHLLNWLAARTPQKYIHLSSTSVYGQTDGAIVDESSPTKPASETSRLLVEMEHLLLTAARERGFPAVVLRVAGIYGPTRGHLLQQYLRGEARIAGDGRRAINMIHLDDVVGATIAALERGQPGEIYNLTDDEPVSQLDFFGWLATKLNRSLPPFASEAEMGARKRGLTNKRVANARLKSALGYTLQFPTFREGYAAELSRRGLV